MPPSRRLGFAGEFKIMTSKTISLNQLVAWLNKFSELVSARCNYLTDLDAAIGDADHGTNMVRGMTAVMNAITAAPPSTIGDLFKVVGMTLVSTVGGASGPLYGTFFLRMGVTSGAVSELNGAQLLMALNAGMEGVVARGKPLANDKTLFDALAPALHAFAISLNSCHSLSDAALAAQTAAAVGRDATASLIARKGRASYLGERSIGHIDPGSASTALLFEALAEVLSGE